MAEEPVLGRLLGLVERGERTVPMLSTRGRGYCPNAYRVGPPSTS